MARFPEWPALVAIAIWASLAAIAGNALDQVAPAPLLAISLAAAAAALAGIDLCRGRTPAALLRPRGRDLVLAAYGLGGYHGLLFAAFHLAPLVEANLLNYLWPLLTVLLASPICGEPLRRSALAGATLGLAGTALVVGGGSVSFAGSGAWAGYACAAGAALCWSSFSNLLKASPMVTPALPLGAALGAGVATAWAALAGEPWPRGTALLAAVYLGALPMGAATVVWELGIRRGRVSVVGALSYLTPLLSTLLVCLALGNPLRMEAALGGALILAGAALGARRR